MIDIFFKSYKNDFKWLKYSLESIGKFVTGYNKIVIVIPKSDEEFFDKSLLENYNIELILVEEYGNGYLYQQWIKISSYKYCNSDFILFCDSDCIFNKNINLIEIISKKIEILYTDYSKVGDAKCWKDITEKFLQREVEYEFMRRNFLIYKRTTLININNDYPEIESYIMNSNGFSEFNAIGAYCYFNENDEYQFINTETAPPESMYSLGRQFWSYSDLNDNDLKEIKNILYENN